MTAPRAILFDLDGTLIGESLRRRDFLAGMAARYPHWFAPLSADAAAAQLEAQFELFWSDGERHRQWRQRPLVEARRHIAEQAFAALSAAGAAGATADLARAFADEFHETRQADMQCYAGAHETLAELRRRGVALALVTNGSGVSQREKIAAFDLARWFDHIQIEGEHGFGKPEERAYRHALAALGAAPEHAWMVGDNLEWEVAAPQRLGIRGIWFDYFGDGLQAGSAVRPDRVIGSLVELLD
jgi:putative hydrolase of the HAD superfamily